MLDPRRRVKVSPGIAAICRITAARASASMCPITLTINSQKLGRSNEQTQWEFAINLLKRRPRPPPCCRGWRSLPSCDDPQCTSWPFVRGIHRSPVNSPHKGQWRGALMFSLICTRINGWVNNREAGDLRRHRAHYDVTLMIDNDTHLRDRDRRTSLLYTCAPLCNDTKEQISFWATRRPTAELWREVEPWATDLVARLLVSRYQELGLKSNRKGNALRSRQIGRHSAVEILIFLSNLNRCIPVQI